MARRRFAQSPAHAIEEEEILRYARRFCLKILVETGTFLGEMVRALGNDFDQIYSIELDRDLYKKALALFVGVRHVHLKHGDSTVEIGGILEELEAPPSYFGWTPLIQEASPRRESNPLPFWKS